MEWRFIKRAGKKTIDGDDYDLSHLQDSEYPFTIAATEGYPEINAKMLIQYSSHCVSIGPARGERFDFEALGQDRLILDDRDYVSSAPILDVSIEDSNTNIDISLPA